MRGTIEGTTLRIEAEAGDVFAGRTTAVKVAENPLYGQVLKCGAVKVGKKLQPLTLTLAGKPWLVELVAQWEAAKVAAAQAQKAADERIESGATAITPRYHDGEVLSGYMVHGYAAHRLIALGLAAEIDGWGIRVEKKLIDALGTSFTLPQVVELARPVQEAKAEKAREAEAKKKAACTQARETGKAVQMDSHAEACNDPREECSLDVVSRWVLPSGTIETRRTHTW